MHWSEKAANLGTAAGSLAALVAVLLSLNELNNKQDMLDEYAESMNELLDRVDSQKLFNDRLYELAALWPDGDLPGLTLDEIWKHPVVQQMGISKGELVALVHLGLSNGIIRPGSQGYPIGSDLSPSTIPLNWDWALRLE